MNKKILEILSRVVLQSGPYSTVNYDYVIECKNHLFNSINNTIANKAKVLLQKEVSSTNKTRKEIYDIKGKNF